MLRTGRAYWSKRARNSSQHPASLSFLSAKAPANVGEFYRMQRYPYRSRCRYVSSHTSNLNMHVCVCVCVCVWSYACTYVSNRKIYRYIYRYMTMQIQFFMKQTLALHCTSPWISPTIMTRCLWRASSRTMWRGACASRNLTSPGVSLVVISDYNEGVIVEKYDIQYSGNPFLPGFY